MVKDDFPPAYAFRTALSWSAMRERLNAGTPWPWREGDSAWLGDYLSAHPVASGAFRLYEERGYYVIEMRKNALSRAWHDVVTERLLPLLEATDIKPNSGFE
ncbi:MAG TPA: hypothetical protein VMH86_07905 [Rhizomicrobium sp.]|nr:hypothetical protein [Rhizomicrobium sp.]